MNGRRVMAVLGFGLVAALVAGLVCPGDAEAAISWKKKIDDDKEIKVTFYGFGQFEMRMGDGVGGGDSGPRFQAQRIRIGTNYFHKHVFAKLFLDFNQSHTNNEGNLPKMIKDAFVGYRWNDAAFVKVGMMKVPLGMDFTIPGWNLDIIERQGLEKGLVLERDFGIMLSGRLIGGPADQKVKTNGTEMGHERWGKGFGYDVGVFNPAGRSSSVLWNDGENLGDALAYAVRVHYDNTTKLHTEASYAVSEMAGGYIRDTGDVIIGETCDYKVWDVAVNSFLLDETLNLKGEYISGENIRGEDGRNQSTIVGTVAYRVHPQVELVVRHYQATHERVGSPDYDLGNTYIGVNFYLDPLQNKPRTLQNHKILINYVLVSGDDTTWNGIGGYTDEAILTQWQYKF